MRDSFLLLSNAVPGVSLRTAMIFDCDDLRAWKNAHRMFFFFQDVITAEGQRRWFEAYLQRPDDWMFVVRAVDESVGCMGFRSRDGQADIYNVILGRSEYGSRGVMARALQLMCSYARARLRCEIVARVLKGNPAITWYKKRGFDVVSEEDTHYFIKLADERFTALAFAQQEIKS
jgi:RimJ/RimL family protein N-acetyltransferase